ncbi:MAG TPA: hypothetical protein DCG19_06495 [Cryomorphaceae bacterium]|nr:hypothetical protein [Owenweeksia sp.]HAD97038.1 hypothetical protein [Cryomorphaceae bacterium]HBF21527.1 hypothetical protein [Cryomorphaceae bacterium]|tara:strand:+ start:5645 stop:6583 length:939 start_codon:yes stop_codon:yes gene_type:complete
MFKYLAFVLLVGMAFQVDAQRYNNPQTYFRKFQNENRKLRIKNLRYLKSSLRSTDERRVAKYREMVLEQAKESQQAVERLGPYEDYDILQKEYIKSLQMYIDAFANNFGVAEELNKGRYNSYEDLKKYYDAVTKAEGQMLDAAYRIQQAEEHFAKTYYLTITRDEEMEEEYRMLDEVTLYTRDMTLSFFRVDAEVRKYLKTVEVGGTDSLSTIVGDMRAAYNESKKEVEEYADFDGRKVLFNEMEDYLEEIRVELDENLPELTENLQNKFLSEDEFEDTQRELERFIKRHKYRVEDFFETQADLIEYYIPED